MRDRNVSQALKWSNPVALKRGSFGRQDKEPRVVVSKSQARTHKRNEPLAHQRLFFYLRFEPRALHRYQFRARGVRKYVRNPEKRNAKPEPIRIYAFSQNEGFPASTYW